MHLQNIQLIHNMDFYQTTQFNQYMGGLQSNTADDASTPNNHRQATNMFGI